MTKSVVKPLVMGRSLHGMEHGIRENIGECSPRSDHPSVPIIHLHDNEALSVIPVGGGTELISS